MNILVVEDHEVNRYLLESLLKGNGFDSRPASNGVEALHILEAGGIDLIISDILMPVMDGFQLCRKVKTDSALRHIPFIIYTATYTGPKDEEFALKIGADRFILKPCEPQVFMKAIQEVMDRARHRQTPETPEPAPEEEVLKLYNERLIRKLEQKMLKAESEIEARRKVEAALRESETRYRRIFETSVVGFFQSTPGGRFIIVNPAFAQMLGYASPEDLVASITDIATQYYADPEDRRHYQELLEKQGYVENFEFMAQRRDGSRIWVSNTTRAYYEADQIVRYEGIVINVNDRKRSEEEREKLKTQLFQAQKLESVGRLAGGVAHDFNNMLGVILGRLELILMELPPDSPHYADMEEIQKAAKRSADLTRQLLAFARKQTIVPKVLDLNDTVEGMLKMLRRLIGEDVDLLWKPSANLWTVKMDATQVDQILANLCVNARDAISGGGYVTIETANCTLDEAYCAVNVGAVPGEYVLLAVSDNGGGMDSTTLENLFEPFFTTKGIGEGAGLGLATVYGIIQQNEGFIHVDSEPGEGTTFKIYLPRYEGKPCNAPSSETGESPMGHGETILLVEDDASILSLGKIMLERMGYRVLTAENPDQALVAAKAHAGAIHLLATDVVMPKMSGKELAQQIMLLYPEIRVLFMSGYTANVIAHRGILEAKVHFIQKPFSMKALALQVHRALQEKQKEALQF